MENAVESILIAFAVIVFVIALSLTMFMLSKAMTTTENLIYNADKTNYLQNIEVIEDNILSKRNVKIDIVINSLYRYYKESFMVRIYNKDNTLLQVFDTSIEGKVFSAVSKTPNRQNEEEKALMLHYGRDTANLFGAPWMGNTARDAKYRVDLYVSGQKGYINNVAVDYEGKGLKGLYDKSFEETFIQYMYSGETISTENGIESITGNTKEKNKIIIDYKVID